MSVNSSSLYALLDCNNFYVSCERLFKPSLEKKPVVVLSNNDGCIIARSDEVKRLGVPMGVPYFQVAPLLRKHKVELFSPNFPLYGDISSRVFSLLAEYAGEIEVYSIDEAFFRPDGKSFQERKEKLSVIAKLIKQGVGIPVSIGTGTTKTLAKLANYEAKRKKASGAVFEFQSHTFHESLKQIPVEKVWGVGRGLTAKLHKKGLLTAYDLYDLEPAWAKRQFGIIGERLVRELQGEPAYTLESVPSQRKSICISRTFGKKVKSCNELKEAVACYLARGAEKLRSYKLAASVMTVSLYTNRFDKKNRDEPSHLSALIPLNCASQSTPELLSYALPAVETLFSEEKEYTKAGVYFSGLVPVSEIQPSLFDTRDREKERKLLQAVDSLNARIGKRAVLFAPEGKSRGWKMKQEHRSPSFTTRWSDIPTAD